MSAALVLFAACEPAPTPEVSFTLTNDNVEVAGLSADYLVVVDAAAKTAAIEVAYADKAELQALEVNFVGIPSDVTVENFTFDFSTGATKEVAVSQNGATDTYVFSATAAKPEPKFVTLSLATAKDGKDENDQDITVLGTPVAVAGGTAKFKGSDDLTKLAVVYTVSPANAKVYAKVDGAEVEIANEAVLDFSDKVNGVDLVVKCENESATQNVKIVTTGFSKIERVWGKYNKASSVEANWYADAENLPFTTQAGNFRNIAADANYIYLPNTATNLVYAFDLMTGEYKATLKTDVEGAHVVTQAAQWKCCDAEVIPAANSTKLLVSTAALAATHYLTIYAYDSVDATPVKVLEYCPGVDCRYGDKFSVSGTWEDGEILYFDQKKKNPVLCFEIKNGIVSQTPKQFTGIDVADASYSGVYKYSSTEYLWAGNNTSSKFVTYTRNGEAFEAGLVGDGAKFPTILDPYFINFNEQEYMVYYRLYSAGMRIQELNGATLLESMTGIDTTTDKQLFLGGPDVETLPAESVPNGMGGCAVVTIGEDIYVAALAPSVGMSLFKLVK